mgnify:CR=1 FL=1
MIYTYSGIEKRMGGKLSEGQIIGLFASSIDTENSEVPLITDIVVTPEKVGEFNDARAVEVAKIVITLADTVTILDGDEVSQGRMGRAILALADDIATTTWIGANGDVYNLTRPQFQEALNLAGEAQTAIWVNYATLKAAL